MYSLFGFTDFSEFLSDGPSRKVFQLPHDATFVSYNPPADVLFSRWPAFTNSANMAGRSHGNQIPQNTRRLQTMRGFLLCTIENTVKGCEFFTFAGMTGAGTTNVLKLLDNSVGLDGQANRRGSSFGKRVS